MYDDATRQELLRACSEDGYFRPDYGGYCFADVPKTVGDVLGTDIGRGLPHDVFQGVDTTVSNVVVLLIDGFGLDRYRELSGVAEAESDQGTQKGPANTDQDHVVPLLSSLTTTGRVTPLTSIYPSETAAAMTSFHTGLTTAEHGLLAWNVLLPDHDLTIESLPFRTRGGDDPQTATGGSFTKEDLFEGTPVYERLKDHGVTSHAIQPASIVDGAYSTTVLAGAARTGYDSVGELAVTIRRRLEATEGRSYVYAYTGLIDGAAHAEGTTSDRYRAELEAVCGAVERELARVDPKLADDTLLLVTADHGHINTSPDQAIDLTDHGPIWSNLTRDDDGNRIPPTGGPRGVHLHLQDGTTTEVCDYLESTVDAQIASGKEALESGLFGSRDPIQLLRRRVGDVVISPRKQNVWYQGEARKLEFIGSHGGQSRAEMLVPFAAANLGSWQPGR